MMIVCLLYIIFRIIVPPDLGYPENDYNKSGPRPTTFSVPLMLFVLIIINTP